LLPLCPPTPVRWL